MAVVAYNHVYDRACASTYVPSYARRWVGESVGWPDVRRNFIADQRGVARSIHLKFESRIRRLVFPQGHSLGTKTNLCWLPGWLAFSPARRLPHQSSQLHSWPQRQESEIESTLGNESDLACSRNSRNSRSLYGPSERRKKKRTERRKGVRSRPAHSHKQARTDPSSDANFPSGQARKGGGAGGVLCVCGSLDSHRRGRKQSRNIGCVEE